MSGSIRRKRESDGEDALRELMNSILSGRYTEETYLADVSSVCRARPTSAPRLMSLLDRYVRIGRMKAPQQQRIKARIEQVLAEQRGSVSPPPVSESARDRPSADQSEADETRVVASAPWSRPEVSYDAGTAAAVPVGEDVTQDDDEDCPTSQLVAAARERASAATLTTILKPADETVSAHQTRVLRSSPPQSPRVEPLPEPVRPAETRVLGETRRLPEMPAFLGPTEVAPHARDTLVRSGPPPDKSTSVSADEARPAGPTEIGVGTVLDDRYELRHLLGRGGIATVYRAVDRYRVNLGLEDCYIAVKIVQPHPSRPGSVAALGREFHNAQLLSHPNVINVFNIDHAGDASFYTMELLDGERLSQVVKRVGMLSRRHALAIIRDIGAAVSHAHSRGVVHADVKPHNIMITQVGTVRVLDFGSGVIRAREPWISELSPADNYRQATPAYASCEQLEGWSADPRDDIYALACVAYLLLAGRHPFNLRPSLEARANRMQPRRPPGLSGDSWRALQRGLSWTREERTMSVEEWLRDLGVDKAADTLPPLALLQAGRPAGTWLQRAAAASVVIAGLGLAAFTVEHQDEFDWQNTLDRAQSSLQEAWQTMTDAPTGSSGQPAVSLPPIPSPTQVVVQKNIRDLPVAAATPHSSATHPRVAVDDAQDEAPGASASPIATAIAPDAVSAQVNDAGQPAAVPAGAEASRHLSFSAPSYVVSDTDPAARIVVRRSSTSTDGDINFVWWTEEGSARADVDYASLGRRAERIPSGVDKITVYVPIISSSQRHESRQFYVDLSEAGQRNGAQGSRSLVTIDNGSASGVGSGG